MSDLIIFGPSQVFHFTTRFPYILFKKNQNMYYIYEMDKPPQHFICKADIQQLIKNVPDVIINYTIYYNISHVFNLN